MRYCDSIIRIYLVNALLLHELQEGKAFDDDPSRAFAEECFPYLQI